MSFVKKIAFSYLIICFFCLNSIFASQIIFGTEAYEDEKGHTEVYNRLSVLPEFEFGKIAVGFNLEFLFDKNGKFLDSEWDGWEDVITKIYYLTYDKKGEPIYFRIGGLKSESIGHGIIFNRYSNMIRYPDVKKAGAVLELNFPAWGFESITTNLIRKETIGGRIYFKPFYGAGDRFISNFALGISGGQDFDPDDNSKTSDDGVGIIAVDAELPIVNFDTISAKWFADIAQMQIGETYTKNFKIKDSGTGFATGFMGKVLMVNYKLQFKSLENNFIYGYFDAFYDIDRNFKPYTMSNKMSPRKEGLAGEVEINFIDKVNVFVAYENLNNDTDGTYPWLYTCISLDKSLFLDKLFVNLMYDKKGAESWDKIKDVDGPNTLGKLEIGAELLPFMMLVGIAERTYDANKKDVKKYRAELRVIF